MGRVGVARGWMATAPANGPVRGEGLALTAQSVEKIEWEKEEVTALKPPVAVESLKHRQLVQGEFWRRIPAYAEVDTETFLDHQWQARNSVTKPSRLRKTLGELVDGGFLDDVEQGFHRAPMTMRVSPYLIALMDWSAPYTDPLRTQFIPIASRLQADHPKLDLDSLHEQADAPVPGLTHRYVDKALFLPLDTCPVYCRFCTRSYAIGLDTDEVSKVALRVSTERWARAFKYISSRPELEDIVISGGDAYQLRPEQIEQIGMTLLGMPNIRRLRVATKGLAVMPQKVLSDPAWVDAVTRVVEFGRKVHKDVVIHTHFNHPAEATWITEAASNLLFERGIVVRNQSVLQAGVNDDTDTMTTLVRRLSWLNIHPYYVYLHDLVKGVEDLRTTVATAVALEKHVRGATAGFNTPTFVCDAPGGGGKRDIHSYEHYDRRTGIAVYTAPGVKPGKFFLYFDPLRALAPEIQERWRRPDEAEVMIQHALERAQATQIT